MLSMVRSPWLMATYTVTEQAQDELRSLHHDLAHEVTTVSINDPVCLQRLIQKVDASEEQVRQVRYERVTGEVFPAISESGTECTLSAGRRSTDHSGQLGKYALSLDTIHATNRRASANQSLSKSGFLH